MCHSTINYIQYIRYSSGNNYYTTLYNYAMYNSQILKLYTVAIKIFSQCKAIFYALSHKLIPLL